MSQLAQTLAASQTHRLLAAFASAVLLYFTVSLQPIWWIAWFAPVPVLLAVFAAGSNREAIGLGYLAAVPAFLSNFEYYRVIGNAWIAIALVLLQSTLWVSTFKACRAYAADLRWFAIFAYPVTWAAFDTLITFFSPHSSAGSLAYSQGDALAVLQLTAITGTPGVVFLVGLFASAVAFSLWRRRFHWWPLALIGAVVLLGSYRLHAPLASEQVRISPGLIAIDDFIGGRVPPAFAQRVWAEYATAIGQLAAQGARLVLLPEKIEELPEVNAAAQRTALLAQAAREHHVYVAAGAAVRDAPGLCNRLFLFDPHGQLVARYDKRHLVPGLEAAITSGRQWVTHEIEGVRYGLAICKDMHFPSTGRAYGRLRVDAVLDPAWDFQQDAWMMARLSAVRGIESGFAILRSSREGLLNMTDRRGRVLQETASRTFPGATLRSDITLERGRPTFYALFGDVFGWLAVACAIALRCLQRTGRYQRASVSGETPSQ